MTRAQATGARLEAIAAAAELMRMLATHQPVHRPVDAEQLVSVVRAVLAVCQEERTGEEPSDVGPLSPEQIAGGICGNVLHGLALQEAGMPDKARNVLAMAQSLLNDLRNPK